MVASSIPRCVRMVRTRRDVLSGGALSLLSGLCCSFAHAQGGPPPKFGCVLPSDQEQGALNRATSVTIVEKGDEKLESRSGNSMLDFALAQALGHLATVFGVLPAFSYYHERVEGDHNALATRASDLGRADGTVLFGLGMLRMLLDISAKPDAAIVAVCAHEFGHIVAIKRGEIDKLAPDAANPFSAEQHADFISGFYAGLRARARDDFPALFFATTMRMLGGDTRGTHGTHAERGAAVAAGFKAAKVDNLSIASGLDRAFQFAMSVT
jgi:hypothetical protein